MDLMSFHLNKMQIRFIKFAVLTIQKGFVQWRG